MSDKKIKLGDAIKQHYKDKPLTINLAHSVAATVFDKKEKTAYGNRLYYVIIAAMAVIAGCYCIVILHTPPALFVALIAGIAGIAFTTASEIGMLNKKANALL